MDAPVTVTALENPTRAQLVELAVLFDEYRRHYGEPTLASQTLAWLQDNISVGVLTVFCAEIEGEMVGFATTVSTPASLHLGHYWQIRDLFVAPRRRRTGIARALLTHLRREAESAGALRMALQTEVENATALGLYRTSGFVDVEGYKTLVLSLPAGDASTRPRRARNGVRGHQLPVSSLSRVRFGGSRTNTPVAVRLNLSLVRLAHA